jgi:hypothetical protein
MSGVGYLETSQTLTTYITSGKINMLGKAQLCFLLYQNFRATETAFSRVVMSSKLSCSTELFEMIVGVLTTWHTQQT